MENQSLNITHLESEANRVQKENEERLRVLEEKIKSLGSGRNYFQMHEKNDPSKEKSGKQQIRKRSLGKTESKHNNLKEEADQHANHLQTAEIQAEAIKDDATMSNRKSVNVETGSLKSDDRHSVQRKLKALEAGSKTLVEVKE